ncbi:MAG: quinol:electron acceptor oxidoreductase subunit ActD [Acidobacteriota bacterium]
MDMKVGAFEKANEAMMAMNRLRSEGFARDDITMMSGEPLPLDEDEEKDKSLIWLFSIAGGVAGGAGAALLTSLASKQMNLVTGGMPIVAPWAFGIIVFEMTALGAIVATLARMVYEARLMRRRTGIERDEAVAEGKIVVAVACADETRAREAERVLTSLGAELI